MTSPIIVDSLYDVLRFSESEIYMDFAMSDVYIVEGVRCKLEYERLLVKVSSQNALGTPIWFVAAHYPHTNRRIPQLLWGLRTTISSYFSMFQRRVSFSESPYFCPTGDRVTGNLFPPIACHGTDCSLQVNMGGFDKLPITVIPLYEGVIEVVAGEGGVILDRGTIAALARSVGLKELW